MKSARLHITKFRYSPTDQHIERVMFVGEPTDDYYPFDAVTACVLESSLSGGAFYLYMINTNPIIQRRGYAMHMLDFLNGHYGGKGIARIGNVVTDDAEAFVEAAVKKGLLKLR